MALAFGEEGNLNEKLFPPKVNTVIVIIRFYSTRYYSFVQARLHELNKSVGLLISRNLYLLKYNIWNKNHLLPAKKQNCDSLVRVQPSSGM